MSKKNLNVTTYSTCYAYYMYNVLHFSIKQDRLMAAPSGHVVTSMWHLYPCQGQMAFLIMQQAPDYSVRHKYSFPYTVCTCKAFICTWPDTITFVCESDVWIPFLPPSWSCVYALEWKDQLCGRDACEIPAVWEGLRVAMWEKGPLSISGMGLCAALLFAGHPPRPCFSFVPHFLSLENRGYWPRQLGLWANLVPCFTAWQ